MADLILRTAKELYEQGAFEMGQRQAWELLFPTKDTSTSAGFSLDQLIVNTYGVSYTVGQAEVRTYQPGVGNVIVPPRLSSKTPITGELLDAVVAGSEAIDSFDSNKVSLVENIVGQHWDAFAMTKNKQALDVIA